MGDPNVHNHRRVPFITLGGASGQLGGNQHLRAPDGTPLANVMLTLLHRLGHDDLTSFGDSTGEFSLPTGTEAQVPDSVFHRSGESRMDTVLGGTKRTIAAVGFLVLLGNAPLMHPWPTQPWTATGKRSRHSSRVGPT